MSWISLSISAALIWAVVNIIDKYILTKWVRNPLVPLIIYGLVSLLVVILIYLFFGFSYLSFINILWALLAGAFLASATLFYFQAIKIEEISRVITLLYLTPLFILVLATIFLGEIFTLMKYLGIFLLVIGAILISVKKSIKFNFGKAFWLMIFSSFLWAVSNVIIKYLLGFADFWTVFSYVRMGVFIALIPIFYLIFPDLILTVKKYGKKVIFVITLSESLTLIGVLLITIAFSIGFVTLVNALSSIQPFFVLLFAVVLSLFYPKILKEEISKSTVFLKLIAIILMFMGVILII